MFLFLQEKVVKFICILLAKVSMYIILLSWSNFVTWSIDHEKDFFIFILFSSI